MATIQQPRTTVVETLDTKTFKTGKELEKKLGRPLGSPINSKAEGEQFTVTLTGKIEIREFNNVKGAYYTTKEGYSVKVNASFDPSKHKEGAVMQAICNVFAAPDGRSVKFTSFVD